jgi:hypothetical protein
MPSLSTSTRDARPLEGAAARAHVSKEKTFATAVLSTQEEGAGAGASGGRRSRIRT